MSNRLQECYVELQILEQQAIQVQQYLETLEQQRLELDRLLISLDELKNIKDFRMFSPFGAGIYLDSEIKNNKEILINVGSNIIVKKSVDDAKELVNGQVGKINDAINEVAVGLQDNIVRIQDLREEVIKLSEKK